MWLRAIGRIRFVYTRDISVIGPSQPTDVATEREREREREGERDVLSWCYLFKGERKYKEKFLGALRYLNIFSPYSHPATKNGSGFVMLVLLRPLLPTL